MKKLRVFTAFSGYDSQCLALNRLRETHSVDYELVGWSEIDKDAIKAHNALFPDAADKNFGDISKIDWAQVPDFDLFTYSSPCQDFSTAGLQRGGGRKGAAHALHSSGNAVGRSWQRDHRSFSSKMSRLLPRKSSYRSSRSGALSSAVMATSTIAQC